MKGLALSQLFYQESVRPMLERDFPDLLPRLAIGKVGEGSECYGYDDQLSQDHDWGPSLSVWMTEEDFARDGQRVQAALAALPSPFRGYPVAWVPGRNGTMTIGSFYQKYLGIPGAPRTIGEWSRVPESYLSVACNGEVFADPLGQFSAVRKELLLGYPEDIRKKKLAVRCTTAAQAGQYNYPRVLSRGDKTAATLAEGEFIRAVGSIVYLLNNRYAPFYKWMRRGMEDLPILGKEVGAELDALCAFPTAGTAETDYYTGKIMGMRRICALLVEEFHRQKLSDSQDEFLVEQAYSIHSKIQHAGLRQTSPWAE